MSLIDCFKKRNGKLHTSSSISSYLCVAASPKLSTSPISSSSSSVFCLYFSKGDLSLPLSTNFPAPPCLGMSTTCFSFFKPPAIEDNWEQIFQYKTSDLMIIQEHRTNFAHSGPVTTTSALQSIRICATSSLPV